MSPLGIIGILLALGLAFWVVGKVCYKKGRDAGRKEGMWDWRFYRQCHQLLESMKSKCKDFY